MRVRTPQDIGLVIRERRQALGLDQATLAARIGVSRQWLVEIEKGKARAQLGLLLRALRELGLDVWIGESATASAKPAMNVVDLDRIIDRARGKSDAE